MEHPPVIQNIHVTDYSQFEETAHILVDVREVDEYAEGHLPGALNIPLSQFQARYVEIPQETTVVLVCKAGGRSMQAAQFLAMQDESYSAIVNLDGGTMDWILAGNPVER